MPVFGTMGPRPGGSIRLAVELLRSTLGVFRHLNGDVPVEDSKALEQLVPDQLIDSLPILRQALRDQTSQEKSSDILDTALDVVITLITILRKQTPILIVMQFEYGTSLFPKTLEDQNIFWKVISDLAKLVKDRGQGTKPLVMMILCQDADRSNSCVKMAEEGNSLLRLSGLTEEDILTYTSNYLAVQDQMVPHNLRQFVAKVTLGNPRYIQETIDQLVEDQNVQVNFGANRAPKNVECKDLDLINLASWVHTHMVGTTICLLESLDPLDAAVLKMSTCFSGPFTLPDLAASTCSRWAGATHFDFLRLFKALRTLVDQTIIETVDSPAREVPPSPRGQASGTTQHFQCVNLLIRSVGSSMVLEAQKKSVKRQALIDRTLSRDLPARMDALQSKKSVQHIPWYYEQAFRRMM
mmetsp:Transcript_65224/g.119022  ORF Transcript_65224/g.119022 Transcript_65224/m.119022 type:complete len:411 (-) Transcript_65224:280-1512(-)